MEDLNSSSSSSAASSSYSNNNMLKKKDNVKIKVGISAGSLFSKNQQKNNNFNNNNSSLNSLSSQLVASNKTLFELCDSSYVKKNVPRKSKRNSNDPNIITPGSLLNSSQDKDIGLKAKQPRLQDTVAAIAAEAASKVSGPRVEIINGKIVIKESSLVVNNDTAIEGEYEEVTEGIYATATYSSFLLRKPSSAWSADETRFFYQTLRQCGTEFSMMQNFFPNRTRKQLKLKFIREEKSHPELVKHALNSSLPLELSPFEAKLGKLDDEKEEIIENEEESKIESSNTSNTINISTANESTNPIYDDDEELIDV